MSGDLIANYVLTSRAWRSAGSIYRCRVIANYVLTAALGFRRIEQKHIAAQVVEDHVHLRPSHSHPGC